MQSKLRLDGIVTVVDARHVWEHIDSSDEVKEQIAFADVILLNKIDLVSPEDVERLEGRIRKMNAAAKIYRTQNSTIQVEHILNVGGFNLDRAMEIDPKFMEPEYPFEWGGIFRLAAGTYRLSLQVGPDPTMDIAVFSVQQDTPEALEELTMDAVLRFSEPAISALAGATIPVALPELYRLQLDGQAASFILSVEHDGLYALYTQHHPSEFQLEVHAPTETLTPLVIREYKPKHEHDDQVSSVGIEIAGDLDTKKLNTWLSNLLRTQGPDIFRMKGILSIKGEQNRFVFQGVHMLFDGRSDRPWGQEPRRNSLIFIGRHLDRAKLNEDFRACLA
jgi:G3E family GTPase